MNKFGCCIFFGALSCLLYCQVGNVDKLDVLIERICDNLELRGVCVNVVNDSSIIYSASFGEALFYKDNKFINKKFDNSELWRVASVTKNVIALAVMKLVEANLLSLEDDVNAYLPFKVRNPKYKDIPITIEMLLSNRSSITPQNYFFDSYTGIEYADTAPGFAYSYSNINYMLLAMIIEGTTGVRFDKYINEYIMKPAGIKSWFSPYETKINSIVSGYMYNTKQDKSIGFNNLYWYDKSKINEYKLIDSVKWLNPAGGLIIDMSNLSNYVMMLINKGLVRGTRIISEQSINNMQKARSAQVKYGLGTIDYSNKLRQELLYGHTGYSLGIYTCIVYNPDKKYGIIILCNGGNKDFNYGWDTLHTPIINAIYQTILAE